MSETHLSIKPKYCSRCKSMFKFKRYAERDYKFEPSEVVFEEAWKCSVCGNVIIRPVYHNNKTGERR